METIASGTGSITINSIVDLQLIDFLGLKYLSASANILFLAISTNNKYITIFCWYLHSVPYEEQYWCIKKCRKPCSLFYGIVVKCYLYTGDTSNQERDIRWLLDFKGTLADDEVVHITKIVISGNKTVVNR